MKLRQAVSALGALAQDSRLAVFRLLVEQGPDGLPAGKIAARLKLPPTTFSFHLAQLEAAKLIASRRNGRSIVYSADFTRMQALMDFLTENCCGGDAAACPPRTGDRMPRPGPKACR